MFEKDPAINNCAELTAIRLQDGTLIEDFPYAVDWTFVTESRQTFFTQTVSLEQMQDCNTALAKKQFSVEDIEAVYIAEWDLQEKTLIPQIG